MPDPATNLKLVKPGETPVKLNRFEQWLRLAAATGKSDPYAALLKMELAEPLQKTLAEKLEPFDIKLEPDVVKDRYGSAERRYTRAVGAKVDVALLEIPEWIIADGNQVASVSVIGRAFRKRMVRIFSPGEDAGDRGLRRMLEDWREELGIAGLFVPSRDVEDLEKGTYEVGEILEIALERSADAVPAAPADTGAKKARVFISYSSQDIEWLTLIKQQLTPILRNEDLSIWDDSKIPKGSRWGDEIEKELQAATMAVLLVSPSFLASNFVYAKELPPLKERADADPNFRILWVYLSSSNYEETWIQGREAAHKPLDPLDSLGKSDRNRVLKEISLAIKRAATGEKD